MRQALLFLPDLALFAVLLRMVGTGLYRTRAAAFVFLCVWFLFSLGLLLVSQAAPIDTKLFEKIFHACIMISLAVCLPYIFPAARHIDKIPKNNWVNALNYCLIASLIFIVSSSSIISRLRPFCACAWIGALFLISAIGSEQPDFTLRLGLGAFFLAFGFGALLARRFGSGPSADEWVLVAVAIVWSILAICIAPTPDAIINPEKLALVPTARLAFGFLRGARG